METVRCVEETRAGAATIVGRGLNNGVGRMTSVDGPGAAVGLVVTGGGDAKGVAVTNRVDGQTIGVQSLLLVDRKLLSSVEEPADGMLVCEAA